MSNQLEQLLGYLERDGVTQVLIGTGRPISMRTANGFTNITARPLSAEQTAGFLRHPVIAPLVPEGDADGPIVEIQIGKRRAIAQVRRRDDDIMLSLSRADDATKAFAATQPLARVAQPAAAPRTKAPTNAPRTKAPTNAPRTKGATNAPRTKSPTNAPRTKSPTNAPRTKSPTKSPQPIAGLDMDLDLGGAGTTQPISRNALENASTARSVPPAATAAAIAKVPTLSPAASGMSRSPAPPAARFVQPTAASAPPRPAAGGSAFDSFSLDDGFELGGLDGPAIPPTVSVAPTRAPEAFAPAHAPEAFAPTHAPEAFAPARATTPARAPEPELSFASLDLDDLDSPPPPLARAPEPELSFATLDLDDAPPAPVARAAASFQPGAASFQPPAASFQPPVASFQPPAASFQPAPAAAASQPRLADRDIARAGAGEFGNLVRVARERSASDLHVSAGRVTAIRTMGELLPLDPKAAPLTAAAAESLLLPLLDDELRAQLDRVGYVDLALEAPDGGRLRANISRQQQGLKGTFRLALAAPATLEQLDLPADLAKLVHHHQGLIVIAGPSGHGKTTTLAAFVDLLNSSRPYHILTIEDPIEIVHPRKQAVVTQRETGRHTQSFARGLKASLREDPDVIVIGELRDRESVEIALTAAETGHLVIATMSTPSAAKTIDRLIDMFPPAEQSQVRASVAGALRAILAQRLLPKRGGGVVPAVELVTGVLPLAVMIREDKLYQLPNLMQRGRAFGMIRFDESLAEHVRAGRIEEEVALGAAESRKELTAVLRPAPPPAAPAKTSQIWGFGKKEPRG